MSTDFFLFMVLLDIFLNKGSDFHISPIGFVLSDCCCWVRFYQIVVVVVAVDVDVVVVIDVDVVVDVVVIDVDVVVVVVIDVDVVNVVFVAVDVDVVVLIDVDVVIVVVVIVADVSDVGSRPIKMSSISDLESLQSKVKPQI